MLKTPTVLFLAFLMLVDLVAFVVFLSGFFPVKKSVPGYAKHPLHTEPESNELINEPDTNNTVLVPLSYDKVVIILIDALRADFVLPGLKTDVPQMEYVKNLILKNETFSYTANAHPPTVTLPRIKAMTTGSIPGFIDVVMNFNAQSLLEDNIITQLHRHGRRLVFYGDDTWLKLYPDHFIRTDGTTSFFVTDYTEVDQNVTRHLDDELSRHDWDVMILHYLGLDHIGHLAGPYSPLVKPKLQEMDEVVKYILQALETKFSDTRCLLLLCGDHGMSDQGSHGGSSSVETATPLIFIDPQWQGGKGQAYTNKIVDQIDITPTLAMVLGVPIPQNNLGTVIVHILNGLEPRDKLRAVYSNAKQMLTVLQENIRDYEREHSYQQLQRAKQLHISWIKTYKSSPDSPVLDQLCVKVTEQYLSAMAGMHEKLTAMLLHYDFHALTVAIIVFFIELFTLLHLLLRDDTRLELLPSRTFFVSAMFAAILIFIQASICTSQMASDSLCSMTGSLVLILFIIISIISISIWMNSSGSQIYTNCRLLFVKMSKVENPCMILVCGTVCHTMSLMSSSFVEEEHQTWYFLTVSVHIIYIWKVYNYGCSSPGQYGCDIQWITSPTLYNNHGDLLVKSELYCHRDLNLPKRTEIHQPWKRTKEINKPFILFSSGAFLVLCRVARAWNQTGDKWAHLPDIGDWLIHSDNVIILSLLTVISMVFTTVQVWCSTTHITTLMLFILGSVSVYCFRAANGCFWSSYIYDGISKGILEARCVYVVITVMLICAVYKLLQPSYDCDGLSQYYQPDTDSSQRHISTCKHNADVSRVRVMVILKNVLADIQSMWILLMLLLLRPHNIALVAIVTWQEYIIRYITRKTLILDVGEIVLMYYWMGQAGFYYQGNSNSISTVDVSAGYIGLVSYSPVIISLLMAAATYAMPIYWLISTLRTICDIALDLSWTTSRLKQVLLKVMTVLAICRALPVAVYSVLVTAQRYHLFVWTVFSPKLLYEGMNTVTVSVFILLVGAMERCIPS